MSKQKVKAEIVPQAQLAKIEKETSLVVGKAEAFQIRKIADEDEGYEIVGDIKKRLKFIEEMRTKITAPMNASLKAANDLFKRQLSAPLTEAKNILEDKILDFHERRDEAAEKKRAALAAKKVKEEDMTLEEAKEEAELEVAPRVGKSCIAKRWTFSIIDATKIPRQYLEIDAVSVNQAIRQGVRKIPGLDIFQKEEIRNR